ncbi:hypothetical protein CEXT_126191 [Caerostris extrusa]|uniref:Uncharacterized protein n=1 Tax=Caerostris extrusa TaxID=172846 RepID=A0AAV4XH82_CAEEX|nr:hypothetical protein CEXT_126191 [Caerostris extrusa]
MINPNRCANKKAFFSGKMIAIKTHFSGVKKAVWDDGLLYRERVEEKIPNCATAQPSMLNPNRCAKKKAFFSGKMIAIKTHFSGVKRAVCDDGLLYRGRVEEKIPNCVTFSPLRELFLCTAVTVGKNVFLL